MMGRKVIASVSTLNQWALDFQGNYERIVRSIHLAKQEGARLRTGPELEVSGYSCEDHFLESDTTLHSWEVVAELLRNDSCRDIIIDIGMPVMHKNTLYNCRVILLNKQILLIRPKLILCDSGNYRESRWFTAWHKVRQTEDYFLPSFVSAIVNQTVVPFGDAVIATGDACFGFEICEELWSPESSHVPLSLDGVEIILNGSGSYMELRKASVTLDLIKAATFKCGGCYLYSNLRGCDGQRFYFNGNSCIYLNGNLIRQAEQFTLKEVEVSTATIDLDFIRTYRNALRSRASIAGSAQPYKRIILQDFCLSSDDLLLSPSIPIKPNFYCPEEEIALGPACWLWDYLRRSGQGGYFLPLSGGVDSSSSACIVFSMCNLIVNSVKNGNADVLHDVRRIVGDPNYQPTNPLDLCNKVLVTCYMGSENSSKQTHDRAKLLASQIGSYHSSIVIDTAVSAVLAIFKLLTKREPKFAAHGGTSRESLALQNIQARLRMVLSYLFAQLMLWVRGRDGGLLVLGSANVDEALRGYYTKYDCSSADVNPIGGISKTDLKGFLKYTASKYNLTALHEILSAPPTAELEPLAGEELVQTDEADMGMTYEELTVYGKLRKQEYCGPYSMFCQLLPIWSKKCSSEEVADKVKHFFRHYAINRHKITILTPSYHAETYSPDDNRFDHRPFLYNVRWPWQFGAIDKHLSKLKQSH
nr:PREDICTED: probable glutamine-dependent NAD(+) synthetase [Bemisia tabaci]XP_018913781.1 PREDICTED: probable glutamine-dependent NAD(+) synthetase [Bemisia tabaci]XP_018913782.1 PREDICTED: probable glutamine-dependent NAD(+) synthetase [Bemisia tabaci]XP_018913783.1 PREDICTED: probable glutamine-dependent NAD(+) synthetase [Bemisia tabaci]